MLEIDNLHLRYRGQASPAVDGLSCSWETSGLVAVVGRSGVGKSTLISCIAGIQGEEVPTVDCYKGSVLVDGRHPASIRGSHEVSWVPQVPTLLGHLTVMENVLLPLTVQRTFDRRSAEDAARRVLDELRVLDLVQARPRQLSGGMRTRVSVARALVSQPRYLFLDEPFAGLDLATRWIIYNHVRRVRSQGSLCTLFTTHNIPEAVLIADRIVVIKKTSGRTEVQIVANSPTLVDGEESSKCLNAARVRAASIENQVFLSARTE